MRKSTLHLRIEELVNAVDAAPNKAAMRATVHAWAHDQRQDKRRRVTPDKRAAVALAASAGASVNAMAVRFNLSPPTVRRILRELRP